MSSDATTAEWFRARLPEPAVLDAVLGDDPVSSLLMVARDRAPVEPGFIGAPADVEIDPAIEQELALATAAAEKLKAQPMPSLSAAEVRALHAFVHLVARPALRVTGGQVRRVPDSWRILDQARAVVSYRIRGVGRIDTHDRRPQGTGWFVAPDLVMTNNHVIAALCGIPVHTDPVWRQKLDQRLPRYNKLWADDASKRPAWDPGDSPAGGDPAGRIRHVRVTHPTLDLALAEVEGVADSGDLVLPLSAAEPSRPERETYVAGYPAVEAAVPNLHPALVKLLFDSADPIVHKRVSPGRVIEVEKPVAEHDASTLGGSSGSAVIDFETHSVVGLHTSGRYGDENYSVALWTVRSEPIFADNGISFI